MNEPRFEALDTRDMTIDLTGPLSIYCALLLLCASAALDLQVDCADVRLQVIGPPERHAFAVAADVVPALLVHSLDVRLQVALLPECARAVGARVVPALLVHRLDVRLQVGLRLVGDARAVLA